MNFRRSAACTPISSYAILDDEQRPVAAGQPGELWIGGPCVGLGYYANPEETAARFRQDPRQDRYRAIYLSFRRSRARG